MMGFRRNAGSAAFSVPLAERSSIHVHTDFVKGIVAMTPVEALGSRPLNAMASHFWYQNSLTAKLQSAILLIIPVGREWQCQAFRGNAREQKTQIRSPTLRSSFIGPCRS